MSKILFSSLINERTSKVLKTGSEKNSKSRHVNAKLASVGEMVIEASVASQPDKIHLPLSGQESLHYYQVSKLTRL